MLLVIQLTNKVSNPQGPRRAALGSGPWVLGLASSLLWVWLSNPRVRIQDKAEYTKSYERLGCHPVRLTTLLSILIWCFVVGRTVGRSFKIKYY